MYKKFQEDSPYFPRSFYALSKIISLEITKSYRKQFGIWACNAILFNHESPLRANGFVIKKIIDFAKIANITNKTNKKLQMGNIDICRDWGWAPEYSDAMIKIINHKNELINEKEEFTPVIPKQSYALSFKVVDGHMNLH